MASTSDIRNGMIIKFRGDLCEIIEFLHVKPGKGHAFVRTKLRNVKTGKVIDNTFRTSEKLEEVRVEKHKKEYLYFDGTFYVFMDSATYEQMQVPPEVIGDLDKFLIENISLPQNVEEALDKRSSMGVIGNMGQYTQYQTANAIENMGENAGSGGGMMGMIAGMGMGNVMGGAINNAAAQSQNPATPPPIPQSIQWFAAVNGQQKGPFDPAALQAKINDGTVARDTLIWRQGMANWTPASEVPEVAGMFSAQTPPPIPPPIP